MAWANNNNNVNIATYINTINNIDINMNIYVNINNINI